MLLTVFRKTRMREDAEVDRARQARKVCEAEPAVGTEIPGVTLAGLPAGGLHLWVRLPPGVDDTVLASAARQRGVAVSSGSRYFATEPPEAHLRIGFAATADHAELAEGARRLGAALADLGPNHE